MARTLGVLTASLLLDLIAFAAILPLFPRLLSHYESVHEEAGRPSETLFGSLSVLMTSLRNTMGGSTVAKADTVLFGGLVGSAFSLCQWITAPLVGSLSDKYGRRPIALICAAGSVASYYLWLRAASFPWFLASRLVGGSFRGNVHLATAIIADVTPPSGRARGMALIGITFAVGFVFGPAVGAAFSTLDLPSLAGSYPIIQTITSTLGATEAASYPFAVPALFSLGLASLNFILLLFTLQETLPSKATTGSSTSSSSSSKSSKSSSLPAKTSSSSSSKSSASSSLSLPLVNFLYFLFLLIFSGLEFTIGFLTLERFSYSNAQLGRVYTVLGLLMALIQGGFVRRSAAKMGEVKVAASGMLSLVPGFVTLAFASSTTMLYVGVVAMAYASSTVVPCLTALVSRSTSSEHEQGAALGSFRSKGALARAFGPLSACALYWHLGSTAAYLFGAVAMLLPWVLLRSIPNTIATPTDTKAKTS